MFKPNQSQTRKDREKQVLTEKLSALNPTKPPVGKPFYDDFDSYVRDYPAGERFRAWVTNGGRTTTVALFLGTCVDDNALPGHYLWASITECPAWPDMSKRIVQLSLHDNDDGLAVKRWPADERAAAEKVLAEMKQLAPFRMWDAVTVFQFEQE